MCLVACTIAIGAIGYANWRKFGGVEHLFIAVALYYYSLFGAWKILWIKANGGLSEALDHLELSLTPVQINDDYVVTLAIYGLFNVALLTGIWISARPSWSARPNIPVSHSFHLSEVRLVAIAFCALAMSILALQSEIAEALQSGTPIYLFTRAEGGQWFTAHQLLNRVGLAAMACAWPTVILGNHQRSRAAVFLLVICTIVWVGYLGLLGNRNELVVAVSGGMFFLAIQSKKMKVLRVVMLGVSAFVILRMIEYLRAIPTDEFATRALEAIFDPEFWDPTNVATGSESMAAHLSLYGVIARDIPFTFGSSLIYLIESLIPFYPAANRVTDSYQIYAHSLGAPDGQGFNIHFAAGAYLNGGLTGVFVGVILLIVIATIVRSVCSRLYLNARFRSAALFSYSMFFALLPFSMRGGPEGLKGLVFEGFGIAFLVSSIAVVRTKAGFERDASKLIVQRGY
jgi:hypothetical protein